MIYTKLYHLIHMKLTPQQLEVVLWEYRKMHYSELNSADFAFLLDQGIINWCWGAGSSVKNRLIRWIIKKVMKRLHIVFVEASCQIHDFSYFKWGTEDDRYKADMGFFKAIISDIWEKNWFFTVLWYTAIALIFYGAVRIGWKSYFNYK